MEKSIIRFVFATQFFLIFSPQHTWIRYEASFYAPASSLLVVSVAATESRVEAVVNELAIAR